MEGPHALVAGRLREISRRPLLRVPLVHDSCADGEGDGLGLAVGAELAEDPFDVGVSRLSGDAEALSDGICPLALNQQGEDLPLARRQTAALSSLGLRGRGDGHPRTVQEPSGSGHDAVGLKRLREVVICAEQERCHFVARGWIGFCTDDRDRWWR